MYTYLMVTDVQIWTFQSHVTVIPSDLTPLEDHINTINVLSHTHYTQWTSVPCVRSVRIENTRYPNSMKKLEYIRTSHKTLSKKHVI